MKNKVDPNTGRVVTLVKKPINIISPSNWMKKNVNKSYLMKHWPVHYIPNAINTTKWKSIEKYTSRKALSLPEDLTLILFGSTLGTRDYNKGFDLLENSLHYLLECLYLLLVGQKEQ